MQNANSQSHTIWSPHDTVKDVAEALGLSNISDEVLKALAMDVEYRILEIIEQANKFRKHSKRSTLTTDDVSKSLRMLNVEPLYGYDVSRSLKYGKTAANVYYVEDDEVDLEKIINEPLPKAPRVPTFSTHWLAVEGVQPQIPQNPTLMDIRSIPPIQRGAIVTPLNDTSVAVQSNTKKTDLDIKPLVKHVLSKELTIYFDKITAALSSSDEVTRQAALTSLRCDPGIHQLVPYFIQYVAEEITHNLKDLPHLHIMLEMLASLLANGNLFLEPYVHSLMPCILTLLLAKKLGSQDDEDDNAVREFASILLSHVLEKFSNTYKSLKPRITRTFLKTFLDSQRSLGTYYGCILGFKVLGADVVRFILGNLPSWGSALFGDKVEIENVDEALATENEGKLNADDKKMLLEKMVDMLEELKKDLPDVTEKEIDKKKLCQVVGVSIAKAVLEKGDNKLAQAILFGEV